jgi:hypothetical protein
MKVGGTVASSHPRHDLTGKFKPSHVRLHFAWQPYFIGEKTSRTGTHHINERGVHRIGWRVTVEHSDDSLSFFRNFGLIIVSPRASSICMSWMIAFIVATA